MKNKPIPIHSSQAPEPVGLYPHARQVGNLLFLSGVGPRERGKKVVPGVELNPDGTIKAYDFERQCHAVFRNVRLILEEAGSSWQNLVDVTVFLINMKKDFPVYNRLYAEYFLENQPCRTTVEVSSLPTPIAIELKCIATINNHGEESYLSS
jgi:2-aminomuconate deaminase